MALCINCGVELDDSLKVCPLCGKDPGNRDEQNYVSTDSPSDIIQIHKKENRNYYWELSGIIAFSGIAACTIIDLLISKGLKWSLLSDISIAAAWAVLTIYQFTYKKALLMAMSTMLAVMITLFLIDLIATGRAWFFPVGFPVTLAAFAVAGCIFFLYNIVHLKGLNIIASGFILLSVFCIILEIILDKYLTGTVDISWSIIVAVSVLPVALVFFYYHYRLKKGNRLDSFFHI